MIVDLTTDDYAEETSWILTNTCTNVVEASIAEETTYNFNRARFITTHCVSVARYEFTLLDKYGDGT